MREILFKAKRIDNGEWVEGSLIDSGNHEQVFIYPHFDGASTMSCRSLVYHRMIAVDTNTICQYTGLTDKNGNKIWENDVIAYWDTYSTENGYAEADCVGAVLWDDETLSFQVTERLSAESYEVMDECTVIGNIFDNPNLIGG